MHFKMQCELKVNWYPYMVFKSSSIIAIHLMRSFINAFNWFRNVGMWISFSLEMFFDLLLLNARENIIDNSNKDVKTCKVVSTTGNIRFCVNLKKNKRKWKKNRNSWENHTDNGYINLLFTCKESSSHKLLMPFNIQ